MNKDDFKYWLNVVGGVFIPILFLVLFILFVFIIIAIVPIMIWLFWNIIVAPVFNLTDITFVQAIVIFLVLWFIKLILGGTKCQKC